jgi:hypothetical protein
MSALGSFLLTDMADFAALPKKDNAPPHEYR